MKILNSIINHLLAKFDAKDEKLKNLILNNIKENLEEIQGKLKHSRSLILYGDVQSGKTKNLIALSAFLFDRGYNWIVILTGDRNSLDNQTYKRFASAYSHIEDVSILFEENKERLYNSRFDKIFLILKKQSQELNEVVEHAKSYNKKLIIFDDECDYWSKDNVVNNGFQKFFDYPHAKYIGISATPFWNIFSKYSKKYFKVDGVCVLKPGDGYIGFHNFNNYSEMEFNEFISEDELYENQIKLNYQLSNKILSVLSKWIVDGKENSQLLINVSTLKKDHDDVFHLVNFFLYKWIFQNDPKIRKKTHLKLQINEEKLDKLQKWFHLKDTNILIINSNKDSKNKNVNNDEKTILIGGLSFSRGNTFEKLTDIIITKNDKINLDVLMQSARWLGYRKNIPYVYVERDLKEKFEEIRFVNDKIKNLCKEYSIDQVQDYYNKNKEEFLNLFDDKIEKHNLKKEKAILQKGKKIIKDKKICEKEFLINHIINEKNKYGDVKEIINKFDLMNKDPQEKIIFNSSKIANKENIWLMEENQKIINYVYEQNVSIFWKNFELGKNVAYESTWRKGHSKTAKKLKHHHKKCAVCALEKYELLYASHIKHWSQSDEEEKLNYSNFLVLCAGCDDLFEKGYITFNKKGYLDCISKVLKWKNQFKFLFDENGEFKKIKLPETYYKKPIDKFQLINFLVNYRQIS